MEIKDLFKDLSDGKMLMKLLEIISGENLGKPNKGILRVQKAENINRCLTFLRTKVCQISYILNYKETHQPLFREIKVK